VLIPSPDAGAADEHWHNKHWHNLRWHDMRRHKKQSYNNAKASDWARQYSMSTEHINEF
jgi:hypothetical protein